MPSTHCKNLVEYRNLYIYIYICIYIYIYICTNLLCQSLCVDHNKLWKILKEMGIPDHLTCLLRNLYAGQEATVRIGLEQTGCKSGKQYVRAIYYHPAYLTYMQSTS